MVNVFLGRLGGVIRCYSIHFITSKHVDSAVECASLERVKCK